MGTANLNNYSYFDKITTRLLGYLIPNNFVIL